MYGITLPARKISCPTQEDSTAQAEESTGGLGVRLPEQADDMKPTGVLGKHQRSLTVGAFGLEVCTMADQCLDEVLTAMLHGEHQGGHSVGSDCINVRTLSKRLAQRSQVASLHGKKQGGAGLFSLRRFGGRRWSGRNDHRDRTLRTVHNH